MKCYNILIVVLACLISTSVGHSRLVIAGDFGAGQMEPMSYERLDEPVILSNACDNVKIIEWRPTPGFAGSTKYSKKSFDLVDKTCTLVVQNFYNFVLSTGKYNNIKHVKLDTSLSFMPADMYRNGDSPRNLNDLKYRFVNRELQMPLWGYYHRSKDWAFVRNDAFLDDGHTINSMFVLVTAHELFHAMSFISGVYYQHYPQSNREEIDEKMAQEFTEYLGLGK